MNDEELDPCEPALAALFREERARGRAPEGTRERVLSRLEGTIGPSGGGGGPSPAARWLPLAGALGAGVAIGAAVMAVAAPPRVVYVDRTAPIAISAAAPAESSEVLGVRASHPLPTESASPPKASSTNELSRDAALAAERAMLDVARTALGRGDSAHALAAVEHHQREFPRGQMSEEREAIAVQALVKAGRKDEAVTRGARFRKRYPESVLLPVIAAALDAAEEK